MKRKQAEVHTAPRKSARLNPSQNASPEPVTQGASDAHTSTYTQPEEHHISSDRQIDNEELAPAASVPQSPGHAGQEDLEAGPSGSRALVQTAEAVDCMLTISAAIELCRYNRAVNASRNRLEVRGSVHTSISDQLYPDVPRQSEVAMQNSVTARMHHVCVLLREHGPAREHISERLSERWVTDTLGLAELEGKTKSAERFARGLEDSWQAAERDWETSIRDAAGAALDIEGMSLSSNADPDDQTAIIAASARNAALLRNYLKACGSAARSREQEYYKCEKLLKSAELQLWGPEESDRGSRPERQEEHDRHGEDGQEARQSSSIQADPVITVADDERNIKRQKLDAANAELERAESDFHWMREWFELGQTRTQRQVTQGRLKGGETEIDHIYYLRRMDANHRLVMAEQAASRCFDDALRVGAIPEDQRTSGFDDMPEDGYAESVVDERGEYVTERLDRAKMESWLEQGHQGVPSDDVSIRTVSDARVASAARDSNGAQDILSGKSIGAESSFSQDRFAVGRRRKRIDAWHREQARKWQEAQDLRAKTHAFGLVYCGVNG